MSYFGGGFLLIFFCPALLVIQQCSNVLWEELKLDTCNICASACIWEGER